MEFVDGEGTLYDNNNRTLGTHSAADTSLLFGIGAEFDINQSIAFRTSVMPDWEGNHDGSHEVSFINELFVNPNDRWFLRLSVLAHVGAGVSNVTGGIGAGVIW